MGQVVTPPRVRPVDDLGINRAPQDATSPLITLKRDVWTDLTPPRDTQERTDAGALTWARSLV